MGLVEAVWATEGRGGLHRRMVATASLLECDQKKTKHTLAYFCLLNLSNDTLTKAQIFTDKREAKLSQRDVVKYLNQHVLKFWLMCAT